ncbi:Collagenase [Frankliniella fusca]|uniref:Collagenase n=1 Tax=Frankliniella fusca TaxID=407009 RepID=A0AAE1HBG4_9NEOP|nr:Collagenase [Frankliniella fusca]
MLLPLALLAPLLLQGALALVGGEDARPQQFPFQVLTRGYPQDLTRSFGSGVLIHPEWVLTSAESVADFVGLTVTLGVVQRNCSDAWRQDIPALRVHTHPDWPGRARWHNMHLNDVALVQLAKPARLSDRGLRVMNTLQWEVTTTMSFIACYWKRFGDLSQRTGWVHPSHICADTRGKGPCYNDGGAPLMLVSEAGATGTVLGVFSTPTVYAEACQNNHPAVYTRVSSHLDWIRQTSGITFTSS